MFPSHLQSSYKLYKEDTSDIAAWLAGTARSLGYSSGAVPDEAPKLHCEPSKRDAQPKTKRQYRNAAGKFPQEQNQYLIPIREFSYLAAHISLHAAESVKVPLSILHKLQRTIDARRECSLWFQANARSKKSDEGHSHFLDVLQRVLDVLKPHSTLSNEQNMENLFPHLHIEEPSEKFQMGLDPEQPLQTQVTTVKYQMETPQDKTEIFFAGFTLFKDVGRIYSFVAELWKQYHQGTLDLITVSVSSNTAIDLVQRIEEDFFEQFPSIKEPEEVIEAMYTVMAKLTGREPAPFNEFDEDLQDAVYFTYGDILVLLKSFMDVMSNDSIPISKPGYFGVYKPQANRDKMSVKARFDEDKLILGELLADFWMLAQNIERTSWEDGLTRGFRTMLNSRKIPIWTLFAARLFLYVHHLLRSDVSAPFKQLQALGKHFKESWTLVIKMRDPSEDKHWPRENDRKVYSDLFKIVHGWLEEDCIGLRIKKLVGGRVAVPEGDFRLFRQYPLMCGLFAFYLHSEYHCAGIMYANALGVVLYTSHLYNAVQQEGSCTASWSDMDLMIRMQSEERVFVGGKPDSPDDYFKRFCLCMGYSAEQFAANRRQGGPVVAARGPRTLAIDGDLSKILHEHYCRHTAAYFEFVEELINSRFAVDDEDANKETRANDVSTVAIKQRTKDETKSYLRTQASLSPVQLLLAMKSIIAQEIPRLAFDYFHLHRSCQMVLDMTQKALDDRFVKYFEADYLGTKSQLPFIVGYIFMVASNSHQLAAKFGLRKPRAGVKVSPELLSLAGQTMQMLLTDQHFGPHCQQATSYAATDGRLMFSATGDSAGVKTGTKVDLGGFELRYPGQVDQGNA